MWWYVNAIFGRNMLRQMFLRHLNGEIFLLGVHLLVGTTWGACARMFNCMPLHVCATIFACLYLEPWGPSEINEDARIDTIWLAMVKVVMSLAKSALNSLIFNLQNFVKHLFCKVLWLIKDVSMMIALYFFNECNKDF